MEQVDIYSISTVLRFMFDDDDDDEMKTAFKVLNNSYFLWLVDVLVSQGCRHYMTGLTVHQSDGVCKETGCFGEQSSITAHCMYFPAVALAWRCVSVSSQKTQRVSSCAWPAGTCGGLRPLAPPSSPLTPQPRWLCCSWTPAASPQSWLLHRSSNSGGRIASRSGISTSPQCRFCSTHLCFMCDLGRLLQV